MSAARLTTPNPITARHGDQPGSGAGRAPAGSGADGGSSAAAGTGSAPPGCSDTVLLRTQGSTAASMTVLVPSPERREQDRDRRALCGVAALQVVPLRQPMVHATGAQPEFPLGALDQRVHQGQPQPGA